MQTTSSIQCGYKKCGTHPGRTLAHGKYKNKIRHFTEEEYKMRRVNVGRSTVGTVRRRPGSLAVTLAYRAPGSLLREAVEELPNEPNLHL